MDFIKKSEFKTPELVITGLTIISAVLLIIGLGMDLIQIGEMGIILN